MYRLTLLAALMALSNCAHLKPSPVSADRKYSFAYSVTNKKRLEVLQVFSSPTSTYVQRYLEPRCESLKIQTKEGKRLKSKRDGQIYEVNGAYESLRLSCGKVSGQVQKTSTQREEGAAL